MKSSLTLLRVFFVALTLFFMTGYMVSLPLGGVPLKLLIGVGASLLLSALLFSMESLFKRFHLKAFNSVIVGLFVGYLFGLALANIFRAILEVTEMNLTLQPQTIHLLKASIFIVGTYLGTFLTVHFSDEILISLPFIKLSRSQFRKKDFLLDASALFDPRILDLAASGILDHNLVVPRFLVKELYSFAELGEENAKIKARRCLETLKKLESLPNLGLRYEETHFSDEQDSFAKLLRLARLTDSNILSGDLSQAQIPIIEGIHVINLHTLSNALKPLMQTGELLKIKVQRYGKEANQGVGYLEDGTMVVVNGGGDYIGEMIDVQVLSVKHTSSGRMIFCNTLEETPSRGNRIEV